MKEFTATKNTTLRQFTDEVYPQGSFAFAALLRAKDIKVNGKRVGSDIKIFNGDKVTYYTTTAQEQKPSHREVYKDENIIICDKFDGVSSEGLLSELSAVGEVYAVHRLDRNTCGLMVFARSEAAKRELEQAFLQRRIHKKYLAICKNNFKRDAAHLTAYLKKDADSATVKISDSPKKGYAEILTDYIVLSKKDGLALVCITLHTGKTHQIRAHMAHIGCPLLGDEKYGDSALNAKYGARRQRLVAKYLSFELKGQLTYLSEKQFESSFELSL